MASNVAAPKNTGGGGFVFEDDVCAWLLVSMLSCESVFGADLGAPIRIDFQTRPDGWLFDDALVTTRRGVISHRFALSIKSNAQFTASTAPLDFVTNAWEQWLHLGSPIFQCNQDFMGLVTARLSAAAEASVSGLAEKVRLADPAVFPSRLAEPNWASADERNLFSSFSCPASLNVTPAQTAANTVRVLQRIRFLQHDFGSPTSTSLNHALRLCRNCVKSSTNEEAEILWNHLRGIAAEFRPQAGSLTLQELVDRLRHRVALREYPDYVSDWSLLEARSQRDVSQVADTIAGRIRIPRNSTVKALVDAVAGGGFIALLGTSGVGKSAIAKALFEQRKAEERRTFWLDARSLDCADFGMFEAALHVRNSLEYLFGYTTSDTPVLVLDGLDRLYSDSAFRNVVTLLRLAQQAPPATKWTVVAPCQSQEWSRVLEAFQRSGPLGATWKEQDLEALKLPDLQPVGDTAPALHRLLLQPKVGSLLTNLKFLDLVARRVLAGTDIDSSGWVGESSLADWFWSAEIDRGTDRIARGRFTRALAERQADALISSVSLDDFDVADLAPLESLAADHLCVQVPGDRITFAHDLYGDWARLRILLNNRTNLPGYFQQRRESPLWHRSLRLLGIHLLEHADGVEAWRSVLASFGQEEFSVIHDVLLEAPVFAGNARGLLDTVLPDLMAKDGLLLRRLLTRFLAFGTVPDQRMAAIGKACGVDINTTRARYRQPYWPLWIDVIDFLHANRSVALPVASSEIAQIVEMWLDFAPEGTIRRIEAAELAVFLARQAIDNRNGYDKKYSRQEREHFYKCALKAAPEHTDDVILIALTAAERRECSSQSNGQVRPAGQSSVWGGTGVMREPWPDGPRSVVDDAFRNVALDDPAIQILYKVAPNVACEVVLATLIKEPTEERLQDWSSRRRFEIVDRNNWLPPLYTQGPFLGFLSKNFANGVGLIVRLVEFATARALADRDAEPLNDQGAEVAQSGVEFLLESGKKRTFVGNESTYGWSAGLGNSPYPIQTALMALEQYFYMRLEAKQEVAAEVSIVLDQCTSVAFLGVLCDVGKCHPSLFEGPLRPLLSVPEIYAWEIRKLTQGQSFLTMGAVRHGEMFFNLAKKFHNLEHRKHDLKQIAIELMFNHPGMRDYFDHVRDAWLAVPVSNDPISKVRQQLAITLNLANYEVREDPKHGVVLINVEELRNQESRLDERRALEDQLVVLTLPTRCRQILDENRQLSDAELTDLWDRWVRIRTRAATSIESPIGETAIGDEYANAIAGCAAVFLQHFKWCAKEESRLPEIVGVLEEILAAPPHRTFGDDLNLAPWAWECFAAESAIMLWAQDTTNRDLRSFVAEKVFSYQYEALQALFARAALLRENLREHFVGLRRLALEWAYVKVRVDLLRNFAPENLQLDEGARERILKELDAWATEKINAFADGSLLGLPDDWTECDDVHRFRDLEENRRNWLGHAGMDFHIVRCAHEWLPLPNAANDEIEREDIIWFWRSAIRIIVAQPEIDLHRGDHQYPEEDERWVLDKLGSVLLQLRPEEQPELLWGPVLNLHSEGHHWPEILAHALHLCALSANQTPAAYSGLVRALVQRALEAVDGRSRWASRHDVWDALLGIDGYMQRLWESRHLVTVRELEDVFFLWMQHVPLSEHRIATFASWLTTPPAVQLRLHGLRWLQDKIDCGDSPQKVFVQKDTEDKISRLLSLVWTEQEPQLRYDHLSFGAFRGLLVWLAGKQNQLGLELLGRLGNLN